MPYPRKLLNDYETVALDLHPHWWHFAEPALALVAAIALGIVVQVMTDNDVLLYVALGLIVVCAVWLLARYITWATTNFVITSDRVIFRSGVLAKRGIEIPLERVNSVHFHQSIIERMLGAGDLMIESGAEEGQQRFTDIKNPDRVQNLIHSQMEVNEQKTLHGRMPPPAPMAPSTDVATQLEKLEAMVQRGSLSPEDFEQQKRRLLDT